MRVRDATRRDLGSGPARVLAGLLLAGCGASLPQPDGGMPYSFPAEPLATVSGRAAKVRFAIRTAPSQPPGRGVSALELTLTDPAGAPLEGLDVTLVPWMPVMGHGTSVQPSASPSGGGHYLISDVYLPMPGSWELRLSTAGGVTDSAVLALQVP